MKDTSDRVTIELPGFEKRRPGRQKTSPHTPQKQNALAQQSRRERMARAGYSWRGFWLNADAQTALTKLKTILGCASQDEALARLLVAASSPSVVALLSASQEQQT